MNLWGLSGPNTAYKVYGFVGFIGTSGLAGSTGCVVGRGLGFRV